MGRALQVVAGDAQAVLRPQHQEIGVRDARHGGERDHFAVEAGGDCDLLGRAERRAVLAPKIELIACQQRCPVRHVLRLAAPARADDAAAGDHRAAAARLRGARPGCRRVEVHGRQQRRARDPRLRVRLHDARDRGRDVEIGDVGLLDERGELPGAEAAPPVELGQGRLGLAPRLPVGARNVDGDIRPLRAENASGQGLHEQDPARNQDEAAAGRGLCHQHARTPLALPHASAFSALSDAVWP